MEKTVKPLEGSLQNELKEAEVCLSLPPPPSLVIPVSYITQAQVSTLPCEWINIGKIGIAVHNQYMPDGHHVTGMQAKEHSLRMARLDLDAAKRKVREANTADKMSAVCAPHKFNRHRSTNYVILPNPHPLRSAPQQHKIIDCTAWN